MTREAVTQVFISAGSNIEPVRNLRIACRDLENSFGPLSLSSVYRSEAVGFDGDDFLNLVLSFSTAEDIADVQAQLERLQIISGRDADASSFAPRTLDLDLLLFGDLVIDAPGLRLPRDDITRYAFVLCPIAELAPDLVHPVNGKTMRELWSEFDASAQMIERLPESPLH